MTPRIVPLALAVFIAVSVPKSTPATAQGKALSADHEANAVLVRTWTQRFVARDFEGLASLYADDATVMPPNEPAVSGRARIRAWFDAAPTINSYEPKIDQIELRGDLAVVRGTYALSFTPKGATTASKDNGKWLEVRKKQPDGSWKIAIDIFNSDMPTK